MIVFGSKDFQQKRANKVKNELNTTAPFFVTAFDTLFAFLPNRTYGSKYHGDEIRTLQLLYYFVSIFVLSSFKFLSYYRYFENKTAHFLLWKL